MTEEKRLLAQSMEYRTAFCLKWHELYHCDFNKEVSRLKQLAMTADRKVLRRAVTSYQYRIRQVKNIIES